MGNVLESRSPAGPDDLVGRFPISDADEVDGAVARARQGFETWRRTAPGERRRILERFATLAAQAEDELARLIAREVGKALWDARGEAKLVPGKVGVTLEDGLALVAPREPVPGARATHHPRGVLAVLAPWNFPMHLANGHIVPALATGNAVILKPSEYAPACGERLVALFHEAGVPDDVLQLVHGAAACGAALAEHPRVDGVLFTGSSATGRALQRSTLDQPHKLLALEMGGSNAILVLEDAALDGAVAETALSIAASTGQRCTSARRIFVAREVADPFTEKLCAVLRGLRVGAPLDPDTFMGPLIHEGAAEALARARVDAHALGAERVLAVEPDLPPPYVGAGLVRWPALSQRHPVQRDELFAPEAHLYTIDDLDQGIAAANDSDYGLAASVFTADRAAFERCVGRIRVGCLNWNRATIGASGKLPFGGLGKSGNDRPAGVSATLYCTAPQAHLQAEAPPDPAALPPGMPKP